MQSSTHSTAEANVHKLAELIKGIEFAMLTTLDPDGALRSRPMATQNSDFDGELWFFTSEASGKSTSIKADQHVNLAYADVVRQRYVSVSGRASILKNREKMQQLWTPAMNAWFPEGIDDPKLALIRVSVESAEYWDTPSSALVQLFGFAKAMLTGRRTETVGEHKKLDISSLH